MLGTDLPKKQKIIVLAEAPLKPTLNIEDYLYNDDKDASKLPKELKTIFNQYKTAFDEYQELDDIRVSALQSVIAAYNQTNPNVPHTALSNTDFDTKIVQPAISILGENVNKRITELTKTLADLYGKFESSDLNPKKVSDTFISEANNLKTFYKDDKNVSVEVLPIYKGRTDEKAIRGKLKVTNPTDKVVFLGHKGEKLGGYTHKELSNIINESPASECHMGSCDFENYVSNFQDLVGKTLYYRPNTKYLGIDPTAPNFLDAMYGRETVEGEHRRGQAIEGKNYKVQKFKRGGVVMSQPLLELIERYKTK